MIITGQPGIGESTIVSTAVLTKEACLTQLKGKSLSLWYILVRCLAEHRSVVFQSDPSVFFIYNSLGVFGVSANALNCAFASENTLPLCTWCLIDSSEVLPSVPREIIGLSCFIIQAARTYTVIPSWVDISHLYGSWRYFLKPMALEEVIAMYAPNYVFN